MSIKDNPWFTGSIPRSLIDEQLKQAERMRSMFETVRFSEIERFSSASKLTEIGSFIAKNQIGMDFSKHREVLKLAQHDQMFAASKNLRALGGPDRKLIEALKSDAVRRPELTEIAKLSRIAEGFNSVQLTAFAHEDFSSKIGDAMRSMKGEWLSVKHPSASLETFAGIQALGKLSLSENPFSQGISSALRAVLGDWRDPLQTTASSFATIDTRATFYLDRGMDLTASFLSEEVFEEVTSVAGLRVRSTVTTDAPVELQDEDDKGYARAHAAHAEIQNLERSIRRFITEVMLEAFGESWMRTQVPGDMLAAWKKKKEDDEKEEKKGLPLLNYADFTDYKTLIERKDNWNKVFVRFFRRPEDIRESLQRLYPIRNAAMHTRRVSNDDELLLLSEIGRILRAISRMY